MGLVWFVLEGSKSTTVSRFGRVCVSEQEEVLESQVEKVLELRVHLKTYTLYAFVSCLKFVTFKI